MNAQREFFALELGRSSSKSFAPARFDLAAAEHDGTLGAVGSTYSPENDVVIGDPSVSRYHCKIHIMADRAFVERLSSKPMYLNGVECPGGWLTEGSTLRIGRTEMWVVPSGSPSSIRARRGY